MCGPGTAACTDINHNKFVVYASLLFFAILWALKLDGVLSISYWWVFMPLFIWKVLLLVGCIVGTVVWFLLSPQMRDGGVEFHAMWLCCILHSQIALFEVLCCIKLEYCLPPNESIIHLTWFTVFAPLIFSAPTSSFFFWWLYKHDRSFLLELIHAANVLFFILVTIKLDGMINWSWGLVFGPVWTLMFIVCIVVVYCTFWSFFMLRQMGQDVSREQKRYYTRLICTGFILIFPMWAFLVLLVNKLEITWQGSEHQGFIFEEINGGSDGEEGNNIVPSSSIGHFRRRSLPWIVTITPLCVTLLALMSSTLMSRGGNKWIFGLRTDLFTFATNIFPCLKEYANISFTRSASSASHVSFNNDNNHNNNNNNHSSNNSWANRSQLWINIRLATSAMPPDDQYIENNSSTDINNHQREVQDGHSSSSVNRLSYSRSRHGNSGLDALWTEDISSRIGQSSSSITTSNQISSGSSSCSIKNSLHAGHTGCMNRSISTHSSESNHHQINIDPSQTSSNNQGSKGVYTEGVSVVEIEKPNNHQVAITLVQNNLSSSSFLPSSSSTAYTTPISVSTSTLPQNNLPNSTSNQHLGKDPPPLKVTTSKNDVVFTDAQSSKCQNSHLVTYVDSPIQQISNVEVLSAYVGSDIEISAPNEDPVNIDHHPDKDPLPDEHPQSTASVLRSIVNLGHHHLCKISPFKRDSRRGTNINMHYHYGDNGLKLISNDERASKILPTSNSSNENNVRCSVVDSNEFYTPYAIMYNSYLPKVLIDCPD